MARTRFNEAEALPKMMETARSIAFGTDGEGKAQEFMEGQNISNVGSALGYMFAVLKNSIRRSVGLYVPEEGGDTFSQYAAKDLTNKINTSRAAGKAMGMSPGDTPVAKIINVPPSDPGSAGEGLETNGAQLPLPFFKRIFTSMTNLFSRSAQAVVNIPSTMNNPIMAGGTLTYGNVVRVGFFGSLICFGIYKLVKWVRGKNSEEKNVQELNSNCGEFKNKLEEGMDFINTLTQKLSEGKTVTEEEAVTSIHKAEGIAKELAGFAVESADTTKAKEKSFIRRFGYYILGGIAALAAIYVYGGRAYAQQLAIQNAVAVSTRKDGLVR